LTVTHRRLTFLPCRERQNAWLNPTKASSGSAERRNNGGWNQPAGPETGSRTNDSPKNRVCPLHGLSVEGSRSSPRPVATTGASITHPQPLIQPLPAGLGLRDSEQFGSQSTYGLRRERLSRALVQGLPQFVAERNSHVAIVPRLAPRAMPGCETTTRGSVTGLARIATRGGGKGRHAYKGTVAIIGRGKRLGRKASHRLARR
jgi:hypothetical protein